jgi:hypothetical protein
MSKAGDIDVTMMMKTVPVRDSVGHASTRNIVERKVWATVAVIAACAANRQTERPSIGPKVCRCPIAGGLKPHRRNPPLAVCIKSEPER